jgi:hypothetical protein
MTVVSPWTYFGHDRFSRPLREARRDDRAKPVDLGRISGRAACR